MPIEILIILVAIIIVAILLRRPKVFRGGLQDALMPKRSRKTITSTDIWASMPPATADIYSGTNASISLENLHGPEMKYEDTSKLLKMSLHLGQLKLFLSEIQFLTYCLEDENRPAYCVYAGSSPSHKGFYFSELFPNVKFILIDPHEHYIMDSPEDQYSEKNIDRILYFTAAEGNRYGLKNRPINMIGGRCERQKRALPTNLAEIITSSPQRLFVIEDLMTSELSKQLGELKGDILFISDIRTASAGSPKDIDILWDSAMMYNWIHHLKPKVFMLKFRPPYNIGTKIKPLSYMESAFSEAKELGLDLLDNYSAGGFYYFKPQTIWLQAFSREYSGETRLVGSGNELMKYNISEYENKLFYYNKVKRVFGFHSGHTKYLDSSIGIDRCGDCAIMCEILRNYSNKYKKSLDIPTFVSRLLQSIQRTLKPRGHFHGGYYYPYGTNTLYMVIKAAANLFYSDYGHLAQFATKPRSLNNWYRRYLALKLCGEICDIHGDSYRLRVHVLDFISRKNRLLYHLLTFDSPNAERTQLAAEVYGILTSEIKCPVLKKHPLGIKCGEEVLKIEFTGDIQSAFKKYVRTQLYVVYQGERWARFVAEVIAMTNAPTSQVLYITLLTCRYIKPENQDGICYCFADPPADDLLTIDAPLAFYCIDGYHQIVRPKLVEHIARRKNTVILAYGGGVPLETDYFEVNGMTGVPIMMMSDLELETILANLAIDYRHIKV